jgi:DNA-binding GntR family transcriptional regulator
MEKFNNFLINAFKSAPSDNSLSTKIYDILYEAILERKLEPGDVLVESKIANLLNISRTPCREAINKLETKRFIERVPNKGAIITEISEEDIKEITMLISVLQGLAVRFAIEQATESFLENLKMNIEETKLYEKTDFFPMRYLEDKNKKFHNLILEMSKKKHLISIVNDLYDQINRCRGTSMSIPERRKKAIKQHERMYKLIKNKDTKNAEKMMKKHIIEWGETLIELEKK